MVNQALPGHQPAYKAQQAFGEKWLARVLQLARNYCPHSVLIISDYNILQWETDKFIALAKPLAKAGLIDAIGIEAHSSESLSALEINTVLDKLWNELQVPMYITEYDVALADDAKQLEVLQRQLPVFYQHPMLRVLLFMAIYTVKL